MIGAFLYLTVCSVRNRIRVRLRRLRQPRYLVGSIVGIAYLYSTVFRNAFRSPRSSVAAGRNPAMMALLGRVAPSIEVAGSVFLFVIASVSWITPGAGQPIEFSRPEVQFLFQAPITRRQLIQYKLLRGQIGVLFGSAVATLFLRPATFASAWTFLVGMWLLFAIVRLHFIGVALRRHSLAQYGGSAWSRQWLPVTIVVALVGVLAAGIWRDWPVLSHLATGPQVMRELRTVFSTGAAAWVLWPCRVIVRLPMSGTAAAFVRALPPVLGLLVLNYIWVLRSDTSFEEASAAYAERRATQRTAPASVRRVIKATPAPFDLGLTGRPEIAILWKNLIGFGRYASLRILLRVVPMVLLFAFGISRRSASGGGVIAFLATMSLFAAAMAVLLGPQIVRTDLRQDLANLEVLKTWPVRGAALVRGELLAPVVILTTAAWLLLLIAAFFVRETTHLIDASRWSFAIAAMLIAPPMILSQLVVQNGMAVLFPAWVSVGSSRARGIDAMGQRMLMLAGMLLTLAISVIPGALLAAAVGFAIYAATHVIPVIVPAAIIAAVMVAECLLAIEALGRVLDRTDIAALEPTDG